MSFGQKTVALLMTLAMLSLSACGNSPTSGNVFNSGGGGSVQTQAPAQRTEEQRETIWDLFVNVDDPNTTVEVNKYIWNAALDVLNFMPVEAADPFSGIIVFGWGTPPGSGTSYKATVYVRDPSLDARALHVALFTRSGPASAEATHAIEDAILSRARQLRIADGKL